MKALIFGVNGQDGYYLSRLCHKKALSALVYLVVRAIGSVVM
ncbi:MAG: hypothetical protein R2822_25455 [Spirosomataceae bacterium]